MTVIELLELSLRDAGIVGMEQPIPAVYTNDAFLRLKLLLRQWSEEGLVIPFVTLDSFSLVVGTASYTIGATGAVDNTRPESILNAYVRRGNIDTMLWMCSMEEYAARTLKDQEAVPSLAAYNPTYPNGTMYFWPTPDGTDTVYYQANVAIDEPSTLFSNLSLPPTYEPALHANLVLFIAAGYGRPANQLFAMQAQATKDQIRKRNIANARISVRPEYDRISPNMIYDVYGGD